MALGSHQKLSRVTGYYPFGDGSDGAYSSATIPTLTIESCSGSSGSKNLTCGSTTLSNGDVVLIHQTRGTGAGSWEINRVASGGGTVNIVLQENMAYTYTDSGISQAQAIVVKQYSSVTVQSGTWTVPDYDNNKNGIFVFACNGTTTITGNIVATGGGFAGGSRENNPTFQGSSYAAVGTRNTATNNGGAGGSTDGAGSGGGYGDTGSAGQGTGTRTGGTTYGTAELTSFHLGSGGSGGVSATDGGSGRSGGHGVIIISKIISITGAITAAGDDGQDVTGSGSVGGGGGGSGGSILLITQTATLGTSKVTALGGAGGDKASGAWNGGAGAVGRIAVHHSGTVTGTTSPAFEDVEDTGLTTTTSTSTTSTTSTTSSTSSTSSTTSSTSTSTSSSSSTSSTTTTSITTRTTLTTSSTSSTTSTSTSSTTTEWEDASKMKGYTLYQEPTTGMIYDKG